MEDIGRLIRYPVATPKYMFQRPQSRSFKNMTKDYFNWTIIESYFYRKLAAVALSEVVKIHLICIRPS